MAEWAKEVSNTFWSEWFWCPKNHTWRDYENKKGGIYHPQIYDLLIPFAVAVLLFVVRWIFERFIATPLGHYIGLVHEVRRIAHPNDILEEYFKADQSSSQGVIKEASKRTDKTERQVERWFRKRRNQERPSISKKFNETCWRFTFYLSIFIYGIVVLWDKSWFWDSNTCWDNYPHQHVSADIYWYYMIELGFYWSLLYSQFIDVQRKDFYAMFAHHIATICLLVYSWAGNFVRIGTLVLVVHDAVDYWLEIAKLAKYVGAPTLVDIFSAVFASMWFITRVVIYPYWVVWAAISGSWKSFGFVPAIFLSYGWLILLWFLHIFWFSFIVKFVYLAITSKEAKKDSRSESDEMVSESEEESSSTVKHVRRGENEGQG